MLRYLAAFGTIELVVLGAMLVMEQGTVRVLSWTWLAYYAATSALIPWLAAWCGAEAVDRVSPRRALDHRRRGLAPVIAGAGAAVVTTFAGAFVIAHLGERLHEAVSLGVIAAAVSAAAIALLPRTRIGMCISCGYDLAITAAGRCPECGAYGSRCESRGFLRRV